MACTHAWTLSANAMLRSRASYAGGEVCLLCPCTDAQAGANAVKAIPKWRGCAGKQPVQQKPDQSLMRLSSSATLEQLWTFVHVMPGLAKQPAVAAALTMVQLADQLQQTTAVLTQRPWSTSAAC